MSAMESGFAALSGFKQAESLMKSGLGPTAAEAVMETLAQSTSPYHQGAAMALSTALSTFVAEQLSLRVLLAQHQMGAAA